MLIAVQKGHPDHPRYLISNDEGQFWSGALWGEEKTAMLYSNLPTVNRIIRDIYMLELANKPYNRYEVPLKIEVFGEQPQIYDLISWLVHSFQFVIDYKKYGKGPVEDSFVLPSITWSDLKRKK